MSEQDEDGRAVTPLLPFPPPPPPQPAARSASAVVIPTSAASENLLLTLPPWSPTHPCLDRYAFGRGGVAKYRANGAHISTLTRRYSGFSSRSGGTGRRAGLKIRWAKARVGSSPTFGMAGPRRPGSLLRAAVDRSWYHSGP